MNEAAVGFLSLAARGSQSGGDGLRVAYRREWRMGATVEGLHVGASAELKEPFKKI